MKLEDIEAAWEQDSQTKPTDLGNESLRTPKLHNKYYQIYLREKLLLQKLRSDFKTLEFQKWEFYTQGPNEETPKEWRLPACGKILKNEVSRYLEADTDLIQAGLRISHQEEKVAFLLSILGVIQFRNTTIKNSIDWAKFQSGA